MYPQGWQGTSVFLPQTDNHWKEVKRMSKMAEMDQPIKELRDAAAAINAAADWLYQQFSRTTEEAEPAPESEAPQAEPEKKELKLEDVRAVLAERSRAGYTAQIRELLHKYGASKLSAVDPKDYEALLFDVEGLNEF
jgi:cytochrome c556